MQPRTGQQNLGRGGWTHRDKNDSDGVSKQETSEQSNFRGEAERCGGNLRREQKWPSRPTEPQHDWEAPRVIPHSKGEQSASRDNRGESNSVGESEQSEPGGRNSGSLRERDGQAKSRLGRATNGSSDRVDRLEALGNGVVPATAASV